MAAYVLLEQSLYCSIPSIATVQPDTRLVHRYDAFNVPLSFAIFDTGNRTYSTSATWPAASKSTERTSWRGPSLTAFSFQGMQGAGQTVLGIIGVPGLPEVCFGLLHGALKNLNPSQAHGMLVSSLELDGCVPLQHLHCQAGHMHVQPISCTG